MCYIAKHFQGGGGSRGGGDVCGMGQGSEPLQENHKYQNDFRNAVTDSPKEAIGPDKVISV